MATVNDASGSGRPRAKKASAKRSARRIPAPPKRAAKGGGFDPGAFAREVSGNFAKGVNEVGRNLDNAGGWLGSTRKGSQNIPSAAQSKKNNDALKKALGRK